MPTIRRYRPSDLPQVATTYATAWRNGFTGLVPPAASEIDAADWAQNHADQLTDGLVWVAEIKGRLTGFVWLRQHDDEVVELRMLYTLPGEHAGMALVSEAVEASEASFETMKLWCLDSNQAAWRFYERRGFRPQSQTKQVELAGAILPHTKLARPLTIRSSVRRRPSIRAVPRAPDGSILLMRHHNPALTDPVIWLCPGGMPEGAETAQQTVRREFFEETGRPLDEPLLNLWKRRHIWSDGGEPVESVETFFIADVPKFTPSDEGFTASEREIVTGFRWWTPVELEATDSVIVPNALRDTAFDPGEFQWVGR